MRFALLASALALGIAAPVQAREFVFDATPVADAVRIAAGKLGGTFRICKDVPETVTGRFDFDEPQAIGPMLFEKGLPVSWDERGMPTVGCDAASIEQAGGVVPPFGANSIPSGNPLAPPRASPGGYAPAPQAPPPIPREPDIYSAVDLRYRDPSSVIETLSGLPGLKVLSFPDVPGPILLAGPASIVSEAKAFLARADTCPRMVNLQALVVSSAQNVSRDRQLGISLGVGDSIRIGDQSLGRDFINVEGLAIRLNALRERGEFRANRSFVADVVVGGTAELRDGQQIAIPAGAIITDRETRNNVTYRDVGHNLTFTLEALADGVALLTVEHEISALVGNSTLGPSFSQLATNTVLRVQLGDWTMVSLAGSDRAERTRSRGIFSRGDRVLSENNGTYLLFAVQQVPCGIQGRAEYLEARSLDTAGQGD